MAPFCPSAPSPQMSDPVTPAEAAHPHLGWHQSPYSHLHGPFSDFLVGAVVSSVTPLWHIIMLPRELPKILTWPLLLESSIGWAWGWLVEIGVLISQLWEGLLYKICSVKISCCFSIEGALLFFLNSKEFLPLNSHEVELSWWGLLLLLLSLFSLVWLCATP